MDCIFCKIINKQLPAKVEYEDTRFMAIHDINPKVPHHLLIMPKAHIPMLSDIADSQKDLLADLLLVANALAKKSKCVGYKLLFNVGKEGGQEIFHLHLHLMGY